MKEDMKEKFPKDLEVTYKLFQDLKVQIIKNKSIFENMEDQARQQYLLELFGACLDATKGVRPYVKSLIPNEA